MTTKEVAAMMAELAIPTAYYEFDETGIAPPFAVFWYPDRADLAADNINYQPISDLRIELYTDEKDFDLEAQLEALLTAHDFFFEKTETKDDGERMYVVTYDTSFVLTQEE